LCQVSGVFRSYLAVRRSMKGLVHGVFRESGILLLGGMERRHF
jgi:hypothetical protein